MKKAILLTALLLAALMLTGCGANDTFPETTSIPQRDPLSTQPTQAASFTLPVVDPSAEENSGSFVPGMEYDAYGRPLYAGATPIPLDPVDMPTATPRPKLTFEYTAVTAPNVGLSFEAPAGWYLDTSAADTVVLTDPSSYDNFTAVMTVTIRSVGADYKLSNVKTEVQSLLKEVGQFNYTKWETTSLSSRTLLKKDGYYANYRGEYYDGTVVRGRVMVALLDGNRIITVHMAAPGWYNESYMNVVAHFRETLKAI